MDYKEKVIALLSNMSKEQEEKLKQIFPELKESEDERMREMAIKAVHAPEAQSCIKSWGINPDDVIAWLEKQYNDCPEAANIEPKFHEGEWITTTDEEGNVTTEKIIEFWGDKVRLIDINGVYSLWPKHELNYYHLWTIQDAKDGDVLVASDESIFIYAGSTDRYAKFYVALTNYGTFNFDGGNWEDKNIVHPSTKKQRDLLFSKMKEVGYEWDTTKKELKEIKVKTLDPDKVIEWIRKYRPHIWGNFTLQVDDAIDRFKKDFGL